MSNERNSSDWNRTHAHDIRTHTQIYINIYFLHPEFYVNPKISQRYLTKNNCIYTGYNKMTHISCVFSLSLHVDKIKSSFSFMFWDEIKRDAERRNVQRTVVSTIGKACNRLRTVISSIIHKLVSCTTIAKLTFCPPILLPRPKQVSLKCPNQFQSP